MNPISATLIVRDDRHIFQTIDCLRPHVAEIVVAHTPCDELPEAEVRAVCDRYVVAPPIADGRIFDWAAARNLAHNLATQPAVLWADSDDTIRGLQHLPQIISELRDRPNSRVLCPYEYARDKEGNVTHLQYRERIVWNPQRYHWIHPCHEALVAKDGVYDKPEIKTDLIVWEHHREDQPGEDGRALQMLRAYEQQHPDDPWVLKELGLELGRANDHAGAIAYLERAVAISGWEDERVWMMLELARLELARSGFSKDGDWSKAKRWAEEARRLRGDWFEPHMWLAKIASLKATFRGEETLEEIVQHCEAAIKTPPSAHPLVVQPQERAYHVHQIEQTAHETMGNWKGALASVDRAIAARPQDGALRMAKRRYEAAIRLEEAERGSVTRVAEGQYAVKFPTIERVDGALDIVFACGLSWEPWNPAVLHEQGLGGSETAVIEMAKRLAAKGHRVRVYCSCGGNGIYDGVEYRDAGGIKDDDRVQCDVLIAWRNAALLEFADCRAAMLWVHDVTAANALPRYMLRAQRVLALSQWHKANLLREHKLPDSQVHVTRNGVDLARFSSFIDRRDPHKAIYSSSADRGLQVLVDLWPQIRERVPDATLDVYYGMETWKAVAEQSGSQQQRYAVLGLERRLRTTPGITYHGRVNQWKLADAMLRAGAWLYPGWFDETSCIGAMEAQAAGLRIVASNRAALSETVGERGVLIDGDWLDERYQRRFVDEAVAAMTNPEYRGFTREQLMAYAREHFSWDGVATEWESLMRTILEEAEAGVLPEYRGVVA